MEAVIFHFEENKGKPISENGDCLVPAEAFISITDKFLEDDSFDIVSAIKQFQIETD